MKGWRGKAVAWCGKMIGWRGKAVAWCGKMIGWFDLRRQWEDVGR